MPRSAAPTRVALRGGAVVNDMPVACQGRAVTEPQRDSPQCAHWGKGSPELSLEQMGKERADLNNHCHSEERSDVGIRSP